MKSRLGIILNESFGEGLILRESFEMIPTCINSELYFTILGSLSLGTEAMLAAPQFIKNYRNGSTTGMSIFMVLGWLCGDLFKVIYFYLLRIGSKSINECSTLWYTLVQFRKSTKNLVIFATLRGGKFSILRSLSESFRCARVTTPLLGNK